VGRDLGLGGLRMEEEREGKGAGESEQPSAPLEGGESGDESS
jgi:hypothetical protein